MARICSFPYWTKGVFSSTVMNGKWRIAVAELLELPFESINQFTKWTVFYNSMWTDERPQPRALCVVTCYYLLP
jgi:hypothetical protein